MEDLVHRGHRSRMRRKFNDFGARVFDTYELLEMLLYNTVPVKDTNPISKRLLLKFGSLDGVLTASVESLTEVEGVGKKTAEMIKTVGNALTVYKSNSKADTNENDFSTYSALGEYLVGHYGDTTEHSLLFLSFDNNMKLIGMDELYNIDFASGAILPKPFIDAAIRRGTSIAIIAHNHPFGPLCPTEGDRESNVLIQNALGNIGVFLAEHYIICGNDYLGFMSHMQSVFSQRVSLAKFFEGKAGLTYV